MTTLNDGKFVSAVFLTFSGNCKDALTFYQTCFGGVVQFETFDQALQGYKEAPVVSGSLVANNVVIHGSDLVHHEGRILGNYMAIFMHCTNTDVRKALIEKLAFNKNELFGSSNDDKLIEIVDAFDVRWMLYA